MKKLILLSAMICAGQMYSMESQRRIDGQAWKTLPDDMKVLILMFLAQDGNNLDAVTKNIIKAGSIDKKLNGMNGLDDLKKFTQLVHMLANKFKTNTNEVVRNFLPMPIAEKYLTLAKQFVDTLNSDTDADENLVALQKALKDGLDPNYSWESSLVEINSQTKLIYKNVSLLEEVCNSLITYDDYGNFVPLVQLLLENGAMPTDDAIALLENNIKDYFAQPIEKRSPSEYPQQAIEALKLIKRYANERK